MRTHKKYNKQIKLEFCDRLNNYSVPASFSNTVSNTFYTEVYVPVKNHPIQGSVVRAFVFLSTFKKGITRISFCHFMCSFSFCRKNKGANGPSGLQFWKWKLQIFESQSSIYQYEMLAALVDYGRASWYSGALKRKVERFSVVCSYRGIYGADTQSAYKVYSSGARRGAPGVGISRTHLKIHVKCT